MEPLLSQYTIKELMQLVIKKDFKLTSEQYKDLVDNNAANLDSGCDVQFENIYVENALSYKQTYNLQDSPYINKLPEYSDAYLHLTEMGELCIYVKFRRKE